jgi:hypothetical protein
VDTFIHTGGFNDTAIKGYVAVKNSQAAFERISVGEITNTAVLTVTVNRWVACALAKRSLSDLG